MRSIIHLGKMLKIQVSINLSRRYVRMPEHFLNSAQISAGLQYMGSKGMTQNVRMYILMQALQLPPELQTMRNGSGTDRYASMR